MKKLTLERTLLPEAPSADEFDVEGGVATLTAWLNHEPIAFIAEWSDEGELVFSRQLMAEPTAVFSGDYIELQWPPVSPIGLVKPTAGQPSTRRDSGQSR